MGYSAKPQGMPGWGARQMARAPRGPVQMPQKLPPGSGFWGGQMQGAKPGLSPGFGQMPQQPGGLQAPPQQAQQPFTPQPFDAPGMRPQQPDPYAGMSGSDIFARMFNPNQQLARAMER